MKTTGTFLALAMAAVAMGFASCSKDDDPAAPVGPTQQEIETKIIGKWKLASKDGEPYLTDNKMVHTFMANGKCISSFSRGFKVYPDSYWANQQKFTYTVSNNNVAIDIYGNKLIFEVNRITDQIFAFDRTQTVINGQEMSNSDRHHEYVKVTKDYSKDIIGLWEGVGMTGYETYGGAMARIEYKADGTYTYYSKVDDLWLQSANTGNEYNVDGDWLAHRWCPVAGADYNYEWWDIDEIKDGTMKWSALREKENGERFTTTFTWKKTEDAASEQCIKANIVGCWQVDQVVRYDLTGGKVTNKETTSYDNFMVSTVTFASDLTFQTHDYSIDPEQPGVKVDETSYQGKYSVADKHINYTFDNDPSVVQSDEVYSIDGRTLTTIVRFSNGENEFITLTCYKKI